MGRLMSLLLHRAETSCLIIGDTSVVIQIKALRKRKKARCRIRMNTVRAFRGVMDGPLLLLLEIN